MNLEKKKTGNLLDRPVTDYLLLVLLLIFMSSVLWRDAHSPWAFAHRDGSVADNYFIALNAKNISEGKGWGLYNGYQFVPFEREISTGAVVFLPAALAMKFISDLDDARYVGVILLNLALLSFLLMRLRCFFRQSVYRIIWLVIPVALLAFMREQWYLVLGEVAASLLLLISASYVAELTTSRKKIFLSGLFAGMALMSKLISILCSPWIALVLLATLISRHGVKHALQNILPWLGGFCLVPGLVVFWHLIVFGGSVNKLLEYSLDYLRYYFGLGWTGKMESTFCPDLYCLQMNFQTASASWPAAKGSLLAGISLLIPIAGVVTFFKKEKTPVDFLLILFSGMCSSQFLFFYFNGVHWQPRYYFIGGFISLVSLGVFIIAGLSQWIPNIKIRAALFFAMGLGVVHFALPLYREKGFDDFHRDTREVAAHINHHDKMNEMLWLGFGPQPFPFSSYYMDANKRWLNAYGFIATHLTYSGDTLRVDTNFYWKSRQNHYLLMEQWQDKLQLVDMCTVEHFRNKRYRILECTPSELELFYSHYSEGKMRFPK